MTTHAQVGTSLFELLAAWDVGAVWTVVVLLLIDVVGAGAAAVLVSVTVVV